ncbi:hypothetical protein ACIP5Y_00520 [Nocardia sp. NPDC088792]|uniref:hypothetical protein n=1 Tax=Nocardia sp. NPDC088792 TaxID=3364332 RepID=UPI0037F8DA92
MAFRNTIDATPPGVHAAYTAIALTITLIALAAAFVLGATPATAGGLPSGITGGLPAWPSTATPVACADITEDTPNPACGDAIAVDGIAP